MVPAGWVPGVAVFVVALSLGAAQAADIMVYNDSQSGIDKIYARPAVPEMQGEMYADFQIGSGSPAPGGSAQLQVGGAFCQYDLLVTFQGSGSSLERLAADLCAHPIVVVGADHIDLQ